MLSIKQRILLSMALLIALMTAAQTWLTYQQLSTETEQRLAEESQALVSSYSEQIGNWLSIRKAIVNNAAPTEVSYRALKKHLLQAKQSGQFDLVYLGTKDGVMHQSDNIVFAADYDPRERPWYKLAQEKRGMVVTSPYKDATTDELVITVATPAAIGVVAADVSLDDLISSVLAINKEGAYAVLIDGDGQIVAHPDPELSLLPVSKLNENLDKQQLQQLSQQTKQQRLAISGQDSLLRISAIPDSDWSLMLVQDSTLAYAPVLAKTRQMLLFGLLQFVFVALVAWFIIQKLLSPIGALSHYMTELTSGNGDLTRRLPVQRHDEVGELATQVNLFISKLQQMIQGIAQSAGGVTRQAAEATAMSDRSTAQIDAQQNEIAQIATAVQQMSATAAEVATNAEQTAAATQHSLQHCQQGKNVIQRNQLSITQLAQEVASAASIIGELDKNVQSINSILDTISAISEQTNLLALNAAIEAARAGEHGRGFSVVADEVRVLSQRTHSSTEEIHRMISALQKNTGQAVTSMVEGQQLAAHSVTDAEEATQALEQITMSINQISDMAMQIANAAEEQRAVTEDVSRNTQRVKDVADTLSLDANQSRSQALSLSDIAGHLDQQVGAFQV